MIHPNYGKRIAGLMASLFMLGVMLTISVVWALGKWPHATPTAAAASPPPVCISAEPKPVKPPEPCPASTTASAHPASTPAVVAQAPPEKAEKPEAPLKPWAPGDKPL